MADRMVTKVLTLANSLPDSYRTAEGKLLLRLGPKGVKKYVTLP